MKLHTNTQNQAVLSNVGQIGEFRIRNSSKAFSILSSGLYANKIRAIIRELSCNAVDAHVAAGKENTPFDLHLPTALEPWFSIRDYGIGLSHDNVINIYTTYFESTKTDSNSFIGALGLGSKSPFSYTDNFTVTATKDGRKGVYTSFINEQGVPSIALMAEEQTTDPNGVEIRFSVENQYDFRKFNDEAQTVFTYFKLRPVVTGLPGFKFYEPKIIDADIIPGVHTAEGVYGSIAIMGNIAYPIDVPNSQQNLGGLARLLGCSLVMHFDIGELDFQASREGLQYIPETIAAIKKKLEGVNEKLVERLAEEADKFTNVWERAMFLCSRVDSNLWGAAVAKYLADTNFPLKPKEHYRHVMLESNIEEMATKYNIEIKAFSYNGGYSRATSRIHNDRQYNKNTSKEEQIFRFNVGRETKFVINDTSTGAQERAKYHWKNTTDDKLKSQHASVYVLEAVDKTKPLKYKEFFESIHNPPESQIFVASALMKKERADGLGRNATILGLEKRDNYYSNSRSNDMVWCDAGKLNDFADTETHYYIPLTGFVAKATITDMKVFVDQLRESGIFTGKVYGVRKADIEAVKAKANWKNLDDHVREQLKKIDSKDFMAAVKTSINFDRYFQHTINGEIDPTSPYAILYNEFKNVKAVDAGKYRALEYLGQAFKISNGNVKIADLVTKYTKEIEKLRERYPLLEEVSYYSGKKKDLATYINAMDMYLAKSDASQKKYKLNPKAPKKKKS